MNPITCNSRTLGATLGSEMSSSQSNLSITAFAKSIHVNVSTASRIRSGDRSISLQMIERIHEAHNVPVADLYAAAVRGREAVGELVRTRIFGESA